MIINKEEFLKYREKCRQKNKEKFVCDFCEKDKEMVECMQNPTEEDGRICEECLENYENKKYHQLHPCEREKDEHGGKESE